MKRSSALNLTQLAALAAAVLLAASSAPFVARAQAQSKYANDSFTLISRGDGSSGKMHVEGDGDHCWATTSDDDGIGISVGDSKCTLWDEGSHGDSSLRVKITSDKIAFRLKGKSYVISEAATVTRARSFFDPLVSIEEQQNALGKKQRGLGDKQRDLGEQQREVKVQVPDMNADFKKVEADAKRLSVEGGTQSELGDLQSELGDLQSQLGDLQSQAGDAQSKLGDRQSVLGDQQSALGDQQSALGDKAGRMAPVIAQKLRDILSQSIQNGTAKAE